MSTVRRTLIPAATVLAAGVAVLVGSAGLGSVALAAPDAVQIEVSPAADLPAEGAAITVTGTGFDAAGPGIYVGLAAKDGYNPSNPDGFGAVTWVKPGGPGAPGMATLDADGTFEITFTAPAVFGEGAGAVDCRETECAIYTLAAHGSPDRSQDTVTDLTFVRGQAGDIASGDTAAESTPEAVADAGSPNPQARAVDTAAQESSTSTGLITGLIIAAVLVIGILAFVLLSRRRSGGAGSTA